MPSDKRLTLNFRSRAVQDFVTSEAKNLGISKSEYVYKLIKDNYTNSIYTDINRITEVLNSDNSYPHTYIQRGFQLQFFAGENAKSKLFISREMHKEFYLEMNYYDVFLHGNKYYPKKSSLKNHILPLIHEILYDNFLPETPDARLIFVTEAKVKYIKDNSNTFTYAVSLSYIEKPFYFSGKVENSFFHLDFFNIRFKRFKEIATNGWNMKKFRHMFYIDKSSKLKTGGYFIGLYNEKRTLETIEFELQEKIKKDIWNSISKKNLIIHFDGININYIKTSFPDEDEIRRKGYEQNI